MSGTDTNPLYAYCAGRRPELGHLHESLLDKAYPRWQAMAKQYSGTSWEGSAIPLLDDMPIAERIALILCDFDRQIFNNGFWGWQGNTEGFSMHYMHELRDFIANPALASDPFAGKLSEVVQLAITALERNAEHPNAELFFQCEGKRWPHRWDTIPLEEDRAEGMKNFWPLPIFGDEVDNAYRAIPHSERIEGMERLLKLAFP
jgi:hypothetical protein